MWKQIFDATINVILFYCITYCGHSFHTTEKFGRRIYWMLLIWIGLFIFTGLNK